MNMPLGELQGEDELIHRLKNQLTIVLGFAELLLEDMAPADSKRNDIVEIKKAASSALADVPELARRLGKRGSDE